MGEKLIEYRVPDEIRIQPIEQLQVKSEVITYLKQHGYKTIEDVIKDDDILPEDIIVSIRAKLIFGIDLWRK